MEKAVADKAAAELRRLGICGCDRSLYRRALDKGDPILRRPQNEVPPADDRFSDIHTLRQPGRYGGGNDRLDSLWCEHASRHVCVGYDVVSSRQNIDEFLPSECATIDEHRLTSKRHQHRRGVRHFLRIVYLHPR